MRIKAYRTSFKPLSVKTFETLLSEQIPEHSSVMIIGEETVLFSHDQIALILRIVKKLEELFENKDLPKCGFFQHVNLAMRSSLPSLITAVVENLRKKCRRLINSCNLCAEIYSILPSDLDYDVKDLVQALAPHRLPGEFLNFDSPIYLLHPYSIYFLNREPTPVYAPILENIDLIGMLRLYRAINRIRSYERSHLRYEISLDLQTIINYRRRVARHICDLEDKLLSFAAYSSVGLGKLYPLLVDDAISDFYIDREETFAYLDHREYGRCSSTTYIDLKSMKHLLTFARIGADKAFDRSSPSIRSTIKTRDFHVRISAEIPPLSIEGTSVAVRKFFVKPIPLSMLVSNGTITKEAALYCLNRLKERRNFTIYGESGSGKTTFAVALDLLAPKEWRKISVETDIAENVSQISYDLHQVRLLVGASSNFERERRISVLNSLLQKSPDYIFFGEVLSKEDSAALFQLLSAGLKSIHTIHADSAESLLLRLAYQHQIPLQLLSELDVLIHMRKLSSGGHLLRRVSRISEVLKDASDKLPKIMDVFLWDENSVALQPVLKIG
ncbi:MAG: ATPase, T2SS/T4P/T4SS family [Candidatus Methanomethylicaceae archaeon]